MNAFPRTLRSLAAAEARPRRALLVGALLVVAAWLAWFFLATITVVESSTAARLEVDAAPHAVQSPVAGRVLKVSLELDREVEAGEVLVELDAELERLKLEEERQRLTSLTAQLLRARGEADASDAASRADLRTAAAAIDEAQARARGAEATAGLSRARQEAFDKLAAKSGVAELDRKRAEAERIAREEAASSAVAGAERLASEGRAKVEDARARREKVLREIAGLEGDIGVSQTAVARLEAEIERRKLRAPIAGRLGQVTALRPGATVAEGERVALVVPKGELRVVSQFPVATAVGRVRAGQPARVRLDGFPFTAYGTLGASVSGIGTEAEGGVVRVELSVERERSAAIPIQHGLTGVVEVEVERLSPASLVLRLAGRALQPGAAAPRFPVSGRG
ncbi:MAG: HlyD family efflux transporter periplasmic adaptor subunit [Polyangiaceae bacterium]|nr:HlyD family efflux transporter periplasmic adaptor subunit [Polyangiaceae bacterium]